MWLLASLIKQITTNDFNSIAVQKNNDVYNSTLNMASDSPGDTKSVMEIKLFTSC